MSKQMSEAVGCEDTRLVSVKEVARSRGLPLDPAVRALLERRFNRNFDFVRAHFDERSSRSARLLNARAYTIGSHIVFGNGYYDPETRAGQWLLAHELAHVVQQIEGSALSSTIAITPVELERAADRAADLVSSGCTIPRDFRFGTAPVGVPQFHIVPGNPQHQPCGGFAAAGDPATGLLALQLLENQYAMTEGQESAQMFAIFYGTNWANDPRVPTGAPNQAFARALIDRLLQLPIAQRPNIIDFNLRDAYYFARVAPASGVAAAIQNINNFHSIVNSLERRFNEGNWNSATSYWWPNHSLPMTTNPNGLFVCTEATNHAPPRGLIVYDTRTRVRQRRQQRPSEIRLLDFWRAYDQFRQVVRSRLPAAIPAFDPASPDYVLIVPHEFIQNPFIKKMVDANMEPVWEKFRVDSWMSRNRMTLDPQVKIFYLGVVSIVGAVAIVVLSGGTAAPGVGPAAAVAVETSTGAIIVPASMAARVATGAQAARGVATAITATEGIALGAYTAAVSAPAVKAGIAASGVVIMLGFVDVAQAGNKAPTLTLATEVRAVPINDFTEKWGQLHADSTPVVPDNAYTSTQFKEKFSIGTKLFFDNKPHWVLGQVQVR